MSALARQDRLEGVPQRREKAGAADGGPEIEDRHLRDIDYRGCDRGPKAPGSVMVNVRHDQPFVAERDRNPEVDVLETGNRASLQSAPPPALARPDTSRR